MDKERYNLKIFGYGLALFIPFFVVMHEYKQSIGFWLFVAGVIGVLVVIAQAVKRKSIYYLALLGLYTVIIMGIQKDGTTIPIFVALLAALVTLALVIIEEMLLRPFYIVWMKGAHFIGNTISATVLTFLFYGVFGLVGIVLRILRKDLLDQKLDPNASTYWIARESVSFEQTNYTRQF